MTTSYGNAGGTGDRRSSITLTMTGGEVGGGAVTDLIDGSQANSFWWQFGFSDAVLKFDFGAGISKIIDEFKWYQDNSTSHGTWDFDGSDDGSSWTTLRSDLTLGGAATSTYAITNSTGYRYYRLAPGSGQLCSSSPFLREIEFKIDAAVTDVNLSAAIADDAGLDAALTLTHGWNSADKTSNVDLSEGFTKATLLGSSTFGSGAGARGEVSHTSGKYYLEFLCHDVLASWGVQGAGIGVAPATYPFSTTTPGQIGYVRAGMGSSTNLDFKIRAKIDLDARLAKYQVIFPATGASDWLGTKIPDTVAIFPWVSFLEGAVDRNQYVKANFGASAFEYEIPTGYSSWDGSQGPGAGEGAAPPQGIQVIAGSGGASNEIEIAKATNATAFALAADTPHFDNGADVAISSMAYAPELGRWVAISNDAPDLARQILTSNDGHTWTPQTGVQLSTWEKVIWARELGLFVAVGSSGAQRVMTSPDGESWTLQDAAAALQWKSVCWSGALGLLVAVANSGTGNRVMTSPDGEVWTGQTSAADSSWNSVVCADGLGLFVAIANGAGGTNDVMTSEDGETWTARNSGSAASWVGLCWSPFLGKLLMVANTGAGYTGTSSDAISWAFNEPGGSDAWAGCAWSRTGECFIIVAANTIKTSPTGENGTWTLQTSPSARNWWRVEEGLVENIFLSAAITDEDGLAAELYVEHFLVAHITDEDGLEAFMGTHLLAADITDEDGLEAALTVTRPPPVQVSIIITGA